MSQQSPTNWVGYSRPNPNLPHEIIVEILLRLPVKSLLQCRSVSKLWCSVISTPQFAKTHLNLSTKNSEYAHHRLILRSTASPRRKFDLRSCSLYSLMYEHSISFVELDFPLKDPYEYFWIVGSCNGLLCLAVQEHYTKFFWNPSTRQARRLSDFGSFNPFCTGLTYGFGYDEFTDEYVVVGIFYVLVDGDSHNEVMVYRSRTDSWRKIQNFPNHKRMGDSGKFSNGALHWAASNLTSCSSPYSWSIIALDLSNETYREVLQPSYGEGQYHLELGVLGELLCVLCKYDGRADLWVMKEYGIRESWTKLVTFPYGIYDGIEEHLIPLCIAKNGEVLMERGSCLSLYNSGDDRFNDIQLHNGEQNHFVPCYEAYAYVESLISPNIRAGPERQH